ncbi:hypothetical protein BE17_12835 [Sorangium cellulosum]|uniref:DUF3800 domain-containing protein n=1 Tax=Sorangium cellulosum TaxID=56 RepID=A0A150RV04_SORCE|nr:hypothetical protein BE17_12835 [Sorangium cellulosum]
MSYILFLDESGHDHRTMPYEVRGGVILHASKLWPFVQGMRRLEMSSFGATLASVGSELKGHRLLDKNRFKWAQQGSTMDDAARQKHARSFLQKGPQKHQPTRDEFTAYGQACLAMVHGTFQLLRDQGASIIAIAIPRNAPKPPADLSEILRKDQVFLLERYFYFLQAQKETGLIVLDQTEKSDDRRLVRRIERYFEETVTGRHRAAYVVPSPFFVSSDMAYPVQAADICIYCINWGYRMPHRGMDAPTREEIATEFGDWIEDLEFYGTGRWHGKTFNVDGITYVPDLYESRSGT